MSLDRAWEDVRAFHAAFGHPAPAALGPHEYANWPPGTPLGATIILFDLLNGSFTDREYMVGILVKALSKVESPGNVYLYLLTNNGTLFPIHALPERGAEAAGEIAGGVPQDGRQESAPRPPLPHGDRLVPHTPMRRAIARRLTESKATIPHFYMVTECVVDEVLELRKRINESSPVKISVNDFVVMAVGAACTRPGSTTGCISMELFMAATTPTIPIAPVSVDWPAGAPRVPSGAPSSAAGTISTLVN